MHLLLHILAHTGLHFGVHHDARRGPLGEAVLLPWEIWLAVWFIAALAARRTVSSETTAQRWSYMGLAIAAFVLVFWAQPPWAWGVLATRIDPGVAAWYGAGVALVWIGIAITFWARACLGAFWSGRVSLKEGHRLVRGGPYRWVRHPIYTGMLIAYLGSALALGELRALPGVAALLAMFAIKIRREETLLAPALGADYTAYLRRTPALLPGLGNGPAASPARAATAPSR